MQKMKLIVTAIYAPRDHEPCWLNNKNIWSDLNMSIRFLSVMHSSCYTTQLIAAMEMFIQNSFRSTPHMVQFRNKALHQTSQRRHKQHPTYHNSNIIDSLENSLQDKIKIAKQNYEFYLINNFTSIISNRIFNYLKSITISLIILQSWTLTPHLLALTPARLICLINISTPFFTIHPHQQTLTIAAQPHKLHYYYCYWCLWSPYLTRCWEILWYW